MDFDQLQSRLIAALKARLQNGELTERRLARLTGISQPHVHNVLKGARILLRKVADQMLRRLRISILDLFQKEDLVEKFCSQCGERGRSREVPVLEGWLGPGLPLPRKASRLERYPFPTCYLAALEKPLVARLARDARMAGVVHENDLVLLDHSTRSRKVLEPDALYVVNRRGEGIIRRLSLGSHRLCMGAESRLECSPECEVVPLAGQDLLDVVKARVVWIGRDLAQS